MPTYSLTFEAIAESVPGARWSEQFSRRWPAYRAWFLSGGDAAVPTYAVASRMLRSHMPELVETWDRLVELAGAGDVAARMLALWAPPPIVRGCSQVVVGGSRPLLVRNYDFFPDRLEGVVWASALTGRRVIGVSDCLWGLLDGVNDAGLAVSLAFGGDQQAGEGFGIPIVVRYLLEACDDVADVRRRLARLPVQLAYNLTLADASGAALTAFVGPGREPGYVPAGAATNHQETVRWPEHAHATRSVERHDRLNRLLAEPADERRLVGAFFEPPLFARAYARGFGTLYTALYRPAEGVAEYRWPALAWVQSFDAFAERRDTLTFPE